VVLECHHQIKVTPFRKHGDLPTKNLKVCNSSQTFKSQTVTICQGLEDDRPDLAFDHDSPREKNPAELWTNATLQKKTQKNTDASTSFHCQKVIHSFDLKREKLEHTGIRMHKASGHEVSLSGVAIHQTVQTLNFSRNNKSRCMLEE